MEGSCPVMLCFVVVVVVVVFVIPVLFLVSISSDFLALATTTITTLK